MNTEGGGKFRSYSFREREFIRSSRTPISDRLVSISQAVKAIAAGEAVRDVNASGIRRQRSGVIRPEIRGQEYRRGLKFVAREYGWPGHNGVCSVQSHAQLRRRATQHGHGEGAGVGIARPVLRQRLDEVRPDRKQ